MIFKELSPQDVSYREYFAYKQWTLTEADTNLKIIHTTVNTGSYFYPFPAFESTGSGGLYVRNVYNSIKQLYYHLDHRLDYVPTNLYSQQGTGSTFYAKFYAPDHNFGSNTSNIYKNLADTTNTNIAQGSSSAVLISIPQAYIGDGIKPGTVHVEDVTEGFTFYDDSYGNLYDSNDSASFSANKSGYHRGNVFYEHGNIVITSQSGSYQNYGTGSNNVIVKFNSTQKIYEMEIYCTAKEGEFNLSWNPTLRSGSSLYTSELKGFVTGSEFCTYPTTIGFYDDDSNLVAVGKFAQPIRNDSELALTFVTRLDW